MYIQNKYNIFTNKNLCIFDLLKKIYIYNKADIISILLI